MLRLGTSCTGTAIVSVVALGLTACTAASDTSDPHRSGRVGKGTTDVRLVAYDSCDSALAGFQRAAIRRVGPYGLNDPELAAPLAGGLERAAAAPDSATGPGPDTTGPGPDATGAGPEAAGNGSDGQAGASGSAPQYSGTNVHEAGVDEPDLVKTDGRRLLTIVDGRLRVVDLENRRVVGTLRLADRVQPQQLLMFGDRALLVAPHVSTDTFLPDRRRGVRPDDAVSSRIVGPMPPAPTSGSRLTLVDVSGPPRVLSTLTLDGAYVDARQVGSVVRVVTRSMPRLPFRYPGGPLSESEAKRANRRVVANSSIKDWLPRYVLNDAGYQRRGTLVPCDRVSHPTAGVGTSMLSVLTFDLSGRLGTGDTVSVRADGDTVYANGESLYVADDRREFIRSASPRTDIHEFDISGSDPPRYVASGTVTGSVLNQYSLSEHDGYLRVATTVNQTRSASHSAVTVLARHGDRLTPVGRVGGLGKGEQIYAVRFLGPVGYVVTFRQTDPLYTLDLSDPRRPRAVGELKIKGYSAYLHPVDDQHIIGVGQEATAGGRTLGTQVSLFDVSDPAKPRRIARHHLRYGQSEAEFDPHAFLYWPPTDLLVIPVQSGLSYSPGGALALRVGENGIEKRGLLRPPGSSTAWDSTIRRTLVVGDTVWTVSPAGVQGHQESDLSRIAWIPLDER